MYVVVAYDVEVERVDRVRKILRKYLTWVQNSVFEGEITFSNLQRCKSELNRVITSEDSIYIYIIKNPALFRKEILGKERAGIDQFIM